MEEARLRQANGKNDAPVAPRSRFSMDHIHAAYANYATRVARFGGGPGESGRHSTVLNRAARVIQGIVRDDGMGGSNFKFMTIRFGP